MSNTGVLKNVYKIVFIDCFVHILVLIIHVIVVFNLFVNSWILGIIKYILMLT